MPVFAAAAACLLVIVATERHGLSLSPDSAVYLSTASHLLRGAGLTSQTGHTLVLFPPGFPVVVAAIAWVFHVDVVSAARILNALCVGVIVATACVLVRRHVETRVFQLAATATFVAAAPLVYVATHAWSEALFVALALPGVLAIEAVIEDPSRRARFAALLVVVASAALVRYIGLALILSAIGSLLITQSPARSRGVGTLGAFATGMLMLAAPAAWIARNLIVSDTPFGHRVEPGLAMTEQLRRTAGEIVSWVAPRYLPVGLRVAALGVGVAIVVASSLALASRRKAADSVRTRRSLVPLVLFSLTYLGLLEAVAAVSQTDPLGARLLSPLFIPLVIIGLVLLERSFGIALQRSRILMIALTLAVVCWSALGVVAGAKRATELARGDGYTSAAWRDSALAERLRESRPAGTLYSNRPDAVWATTRLDARCLPPQLGEQLCLGSGGAPSDLRPLESNREPAAFAWFATSHEPVPPAPHGKIRFRLLARVADGALYAIVPSL